MFWFLDKSYATGRIIIVYGTQNPDEEGNSYDKESALQLKDNLNEMFSKSYGVSPAIIVKSDKELTDEDLKENIILVGGQDKVRSRLFSPIMDLPDIISRVWMVIGKRHGACHLFYHFFNHVKKFIIFGDSGKNKHRGGF